MTLNYVWEAFTWTKKDGNGSSSIRNAIQGKLLGRCLQNPFVTTFIMNLMGRLTKLRLTGTINYYIRAFETLAFHIVGVGNEFYLECFISGLKEAIQAQVWMHHPSTWMEACTKAIELECALAAQSPRPHFIAKGHPT